MIRTISALALAGALALPWPALAGDVAGTLSITVAPPAMALVINPARRRSPAPPPPAR